MARIRFRPSWTPLCIPSPRGWRSGVVGCWPPSRESASPPSTVSGRAMISNRTWQKPSSCRGMPFFWRSWRTSWDSVTSDAGIRSSCGACDAWVGSLPQRLRCTWWWTTTAPPNIPESGIGWNVTRALFLISCRPGTVGCIWWSAGSANSLGSESGATRLEASPTCKKPSKNSSTHGTQTQSPSSGRPRSSRSWKSSRAVGKRWSRSNPAAPCLASERPRGNWGNELSGYFADTLR